MITETYLPHVDLMLSALRITKDRLDSRSKVAVPAGLMKRLLTEVARAMPFDKAFYRTTYPDLAQARDAGKVKDLHLHFIETGYLEGRFASAPSVDEAFYLQSNPDVRQAVASGQLKSGAEHYLRSGAAEGRSPRADLSDEIQRWRDLLQA